MSKVSPTYGIKESEPFIPTLFHGIAWTDRARNHVSTHPFLQTLFSKQPLWGSGIAQILLTYENRASSLPLLLPNGSAPNRVISPFSDLESLSSVDFDKYCSKSVKSIIQDLSKISDVLPVELGIITSTDPHAVEQWYPQWDNIQEKAVTEGSQFIDWEILYINNQRCFCGPSFYQLATRSFILLGVDPRRTLWIVCCPPDEHNDFNSLDLQIARNCALLTDKEGAQPLCINISSYQLPNDPPWANKNRAVTLCTLLDFAPESQEKAGIVTSFKNFDLNDIVCCAAISLHPRCSILLDKKECLNWLRDYKDGAQTNLKSAEEYYCGLLNNSLPWNADRKSTSDEFSSKIFKDGAVFDHRSGAISFDAYEWQLDLVNNSLQADFQRILEYFSELTEIRWQ